MLPQASCQNTLDVYFTVRGYKFNHLAINSFSAVTGNAGFTLASAATSVVEFMDKWSNLCPPTVCEDLTPKAYVYVNLSADMGQLHSNCL